MVVYGFWLLLLYLALKATFSAPKFVGTERSYVINWFWINGEKKFYLAICVFNVKYHFFAPYQELPDT